MPSAKVQEALEALTRVHLPLGATWAFLLLRSERLGEQGAGAEKEGQE